MFLLFQPNCFWFHVSFRGVNQYGLNLAEIILVWPRGRYHCFTCLKKIGLKYHEVPDKFWEDYGGPLLWDISHSMFWCIHNGAYIWATRIGSHFNAQEIRLSIFMFGGSRSGYARKRWISSWPSPVPENRVDCRNPPVSSDLYFWFSVFVSPFKFHTTPQNDDVGEVCSDSQVMQWTS